MKFIHVADIHLGMIPEKNSLTGELREKELFDSFYKLVELAGAEKMDLLLIAGDLFHRQPKVRELKELDACFRQVSETEIVIVAGNHDYISGTSTYKDFAWAPNVHFITDGDITRISFDEMSVDVYGFSYQTRNIKENKLEGISVQDSGNINILLAHGGDPDNVPFNEKTIDSLSFDYAALGHIHKSGAFGKCGWYAGSLEPLDKNETGKHGFIRGTIEIDEWGQKQIFTEFVPFAKREYFKEKISLDASMTNVDLKQKIKEVIKEKGEMNYFIFELTGRRDPEIKLDIEGMLGRRCFENFNGEAGEVLEIVDKTVPDYDFDRLQIENKDNVIGMFIEAIKESPSDEELQGKALYYGVAALQGILEK